MSSKSRAGPRPPLVLRVLGASIAPLLFETCRTHGDPGGPGDVVAFALLARKLGRLVTPTPIETS